MTQSIFYSWQSDTQNNINRNFIENALEKAIKTLRNDADIQNAMPDEKFILDKDTKDLPGTPPITDAILSKISACTVFVPDLTFIGKSDKKRLISNPNVLIEYGYALSELTNTRLVPVMNTAFGKPDALNLPFNMRHLRNPIEYCLKEDATSQERAEVKKELVRDLIEAIKSILIHQAGIKKLGELIEPFQGTLHTAEPSIFFDQYASFLEPHKHGEGVGEIFPPNEHLFLHLIPNEKATDITSRKEALDIIKKNELMPFGAINQPYAYGRNKWGAYTVIVDEGKIEKCTELLFKTGEIWGIDAWTIDRARIIDACGTQFGFFLMTTIQPLYVHTLKKYLSVAKEIEMQLPIHLRVGATGVNGYRMGRETGFERWYQGSVLEDNILYEAEITDYDLKPEEILKPFFNKIWEECGVDRLD